MTDFKQELKSYLPIDIELLLKTNPDMPDNLKNAVLLYNKALSNIHIKSEDIAIIELKKAISLNSQFYEAINLLGLVYAYTKEYNKARECFKKVLHDSPREKKASEYLKELEADPNSSEIVKDKHKEKKASTDKEAKRSKASEPAFDFLKLLELSAVKYAIGFIAGILVFFIISTLVNSGKTSEPTVSQSVYDSAVKISEQFQKKYDEAIMANKALQQQVDELKMTELIYKNLSQLLEIDNKVSQGNYVEAADMLVALREVQLNEVQQEKYNILCSRTMTKAAQQLYTKGRELYKSKKYAESLLYFDKVVVYVDEWDYLTATMYYIGVCHQETDNKQKALEVFNEVIAKYPTSSYANYARGRINTINAAG